MNDSERQQVIADFGEAVNMAPKEIERWLESEESRSVGESDDGGESKGRRSGKRILEIQQKKQSELSDDDLAHMKRVVGYVNRHLAQRPSKGDLETSKWRYSLMNWGHDPLQ